MKSKVAIGRLSLKVRAARRISALALAAGTVLLVGCSDSSTNSIDLNQAGGISLNPPEFLISRAIVQSNLTPRVLVDVDGVSYEAEQINLSTAPWLGQVYVPEGSDPTITITWLETQVAGLPASYNGELPLAVYTGSAGTIDTNESLEIATSQFVIQSSVTNPLPQLDIDSDGASNIQERLAGSRPADPADLPSNVTISYNDRAPVIDGLYDSVWNSAQFLDNDSSNLSINKLLVDTGVFDTSAGSEFRWAGMHDGQYLYLMVFAENGENQTPQSDSGAFVFEDDSVDLYLDSNNSKGTGYDQVDDFHVIVALQTSEGLDNHSSLPEARIQVGNNSAPIPLNALTYAVCLCASAQQVYEFRLDIEAFEIPIDTTFGLEVHVNNDIDGNSRDVKWAWFNDTGIDDTWRYPLRMGNARLEPVPTN